MQSHSISDGSTSSVPMNGVLAPVAAQPQDNTSMAGSVTTGPLDLRYNNNTGQRVPLHTPSTGIPIAAQGMPMTALGMASVQIPMFHSNIGKSSPPEVFSNLKLRSGKWIPEEEQYADLLIELFEKGLIMECDNGATLRSFLSRKLHCAPMRVSKKYAGKYLQVAMQTLSF